MSQFDEVFIAMCKNILDTGYFNDSEDTRAHWSDGTPARTIKESCVVNRYDLSKEVPIMTLRPVPVKSCIDEMLWIWQKKSNDISELRSNIWNAWAKPESSNNIIEVEPKTPIISLSKESSMGDVHADDIKTYFGANHKRWCNIWRKVIKKVNRGKATITKDFLCCENFLRWIMANNRYDKDALAKLLLTTRYYSTTDTYSPDTCLLVNEYDNRRLMSKYWYEYDGRMFFFREELLLYLFSKDNEYTTGKNIRKLIKSHNVKVFNTQVLNERGKLWRFALDIRHTIGKSYGYQLGVKYAFPEGNMDQVDNLLYNLKHHPNSRRILTSMYNFQDLHDMSLYPCAYSLTLNVKKDRLNAILNQRSQDILTANAWNVFQYAVLLYMLAHVSGLQPGELVHVIADAHIYDRHIPIIKDLISRPTYPAPTLIINHKSNFYDYRTEDFILKNYQHNEQLKLEVAI